MEKALQKDFAFQEKNFEASKKFAQELKKATNWRSLKIKARYCVEEATQKDLYFHLPHFEFKKILSNMRESKL